MEEEKYSEEWFSIRAGINLSCSEKRCLYLNKDISLLEYSNDNLPIFYDMVISDDFLTQVSKDQFIINFWEKYTKSKKYRQKVIGKYLFWFNKKFIGVIDDIMIVDYYGTRKDSKYLIQISNRSENY